MGVERDGRCPGVHNKAQRVGAVHKGGDVDAAVVHERERNLAYGRRLGGLCEYVERKKDGA